MGGMIGMVLTCIVSVAPPDGLGSLPPTCAWATPTECAAWDAEKAATEMAVRVVCGGERR